MVHAHSVYVDACVRRGATPNVYVDTCVRRGEGREGGRKGDWRHTELRASREPMPRRGLPPTKKVAAFPKL